MRKSKGFSKELENFSKNYKEEVQEMLVLTEEHVGGASSWVEGIWMPSVQFLASADLNSGEINGGRGQLCWLAKDGDRDGWVFNLKPFTVYHVKCRRQKEENEQNDIPAQRENRYMLVEVVGRELQNEGLLKVLEEYKKPVWIEDALCGKFELERAYNWFSARLPWLTGECSVSLECDEEGGTTADGALAAFREIYADLGKWDQEFCAFAAAELTELANEWQDEDDYDDGEDTAGGNAPGPITEEIFSKRISIGEFTIDAKGNYTVYYEDDDMFFGHVIVIDGNIRDGMRSADIAG